MDNEPSAYTMHSNRMKQLPVRRNRTRKLMTPENTTTSWRTRVTALVSWTKMTVACRRRRRRTSTIYVPQGTQHLSPCCRSGSGGRVTAPKIFHRCRRKRNWWRLCDTKNRKGTREALSAWVLPHCASRRSRWSTPKGRSRRVSETHLTSTPHID